MRIALVSPYSLSVPGGVQGQVVGLAHALRSLGHHADVIAPGAAGDAMPDAIGAGRTFNVRVNGSVAALALQPAAVARTRRALRDGGYDVVHLHEPLAPSITLAALADHTLPTVGTFHAAGHRTPYRWADVPLRHIAHRLDARAAVSGPAACLAQRHLGGRYTIIGNGIDVHEYHAAPPVPVDRPTVLFIGRHEARKGLSVLLEAVQYLGADLTVWVAGEGPETPRLRRHYGADQRIQWLGPIDDAEKRSRLRSATVLCAPALGGESFGMVVLEAMAADTPVVASDIEGYRVPTNDGHAAVLVPPGQPRQLADALRLVVSDRSTREGLRLAGAAQAQMHSMHTVAERYVELYTSVR